MTMNLLWLPRMSISAAEEINCCFSANELRLGGGGWAWGGGEGQGRKKTTMMCEN